MTDIERLWEAEGRPMVGISILVVRGNEILLGQRKNSHGAGEYGGLGGHLENGETYEDCVRRELAEECGTDMEVRIATRPLCVTNLRTYLPKHYIDIGILAEWVSGEPVNTEPHKLDGWEWHPMSQLPDNCFSVVPNLVDAHLTGKIFYDA